MMAHNFQLQSYLPIPPSNQTLSLGHDIEDYFLPREQQSDIQQQDSEVEERNESMKTPMDQSDGHEKLSEKTITFYAAYRRWRLEQVIRATVDQWQMGRALNPAIGVRMHPVLKSQYNTRIRNLRLQFARAHLTWKANEWLSVLFSDKTWIPGIHPECGVGCIQRKSGCMLWISIIDGHTGPAVILDCSDIDNPVSASAYIRQVLPMVQWKQHLRRSNGGPNTSFLFQHSNAPSHGARKTVVALENMRIPTMKWPPRSPDLNPAVTVRQQLNNHLQLQFHERMTKAELHSAIFNAWKDFPDQYVYHVISTMRERCEAVIAAGGGPTWFSQ
jgi:hypothetical protein